MSKEYLFVFNQMYSDEGNAGLGTKRMFEMMNQGPTKIAIIGAGLSEELTLIGQVAQHYCIPLLSFSATASNILNRDLFKSVYITNYLGESVNPARIAIMKYFRWSNVATLVYKDQVFETQMAEFHQQLQENNFTLVTSGVITDLLQVSEQIIRIKAYKQGVYGKLYQWILTGASMYDNWIHSFFSSDAATRSTVPCSREEVVEASRNYLVVDDVYLRPDNQTTTISGKSAAEYQLTVDELVKTTQSLVSRSHPYGYDAVWALALALNLTEKKLSNAAINATSSLLDFNYSRTDLFDLLTRSFQEVTFEGVSGPVSFNKFGQRVGSHLIFQFYNDTKTVVGSMNDISVLKWTVVVSSLFDGGRHPRDRYENIIVKLPPDTRAVFVVLFMNSAGFLVAFGFFFFNFHYRNNRYIKMSSPSINNIIVMGCLIMYIFVYIQTADYTGWLSKYGDIICMVIRDVRLFTQVFALVVVDFVILLPWSTLYGLVKKEFQLKQEIYWYMAEYVYKGLLLIFGAFLAWETRMVSVPALNDSKVIGFCIYNITVVCAFVVPVTHVLGDERKTLTFVLVSVFVSACTSLVLCILFIPKIRLRNQVEENRFVVSLRAQTIQCVRPSNKVPSIDIQLVPASTLSASAQSGQFDRSQGSRDVVFTVENSTSKQNGSDEMISGLTQDGEYQCDVPNLQVEVQRLTARLSEELEAVSKLRSSLQRESNRMFNFHKIGQDYVIFKNGVGLTDDRLLLSKQPHCDSTV
ncbi:hypothetical protein Btru_051480 [Bulinus truncatus]|nr:hypothetical protein Btru_051480 [Bulinus truncatus]